MSLDQFKHYSATSPDEASSTLAKLEDKALLIAGGTDLLGALKDRIHPTYPEALVDIKTITGLSYIEDDDKGLRIGALTKLHDIEKNRIIKEKYRMLAEAARSVASPQIRNMATIGGNICQEPRCWYYRYPENKFYCVRKSGKICNALNGENQFHSIFGAARIVRPPCSSNCPGSIDIPSYLSKIRDNELDEAATILLKSNPIPAITGRVCPHFCENECNRKEFDEPVSVRSIERFVGDYILNNANRILKPAQIDTGKKIAIVGSGPAGLSAAYYLRMLGHSVAVFDKMTEAGGMLTYGIPAYRLPKNIVRKQIKVLQDIGIEFKLKTNVGKDITLEDLKTRFDAIFLASGNWEQRTLPIDNKELLLSGLEFLINVNLGIKRAPGTRILVIGGGNVAIDVATSALRLGAKEVIMACLESREEMPAIPWEIEQAVQEGVKLMPSWGPSKILITSGKVSGMELVRCTCVFDSVGNFSPSFDKNIKESVKVDQIILAIGQKADLSYIDPSLKIEHGLIVVDKDTQTTNMSGVFAGGDIANSKVSVIEAISSGRRAAEAINLYLMNTKVYIQNDNNKSIGLLRKFNNTYLKKTTRVKMPERNISERSIDAEDALGLYLNQMEAEANRCFNCGCLAVNASDIATALTALDAKIKTTKRTVEAEEFFTAGPMKTTGLDIDELVTEIIIPPPKPNSNQTFLKFRIRKSIDFPILNVACIISKDSDKVNDARIVLGAAAPIPLRIRESEDFLKEREPSAEAAEQASVIAIKAAIPLVKNTYKVQIAKALIRRAIKATY